MRGDRYKKATKQPLPAPFYCQGLYMVACSILPERKHLRCFEGSRKERIGSAIRSRRKAIQPGTSTGPFCLVSEDQTAGMSLSYVVKLFAIACDQSLRRYRKNAEIILNPHKITVDLPLATYHTLKPVKNGVKRICTREITPKMRRFHGKTPAKCITTRFPGLNFLTGGVCFNNLQNTPFVSRYPKV